MGEIVCRGCGFSIRGVLPEGGLRCIQCNGELEYADNGSEGSGAVESLKDSDNAQFRPVEERHSFVFSGNSPEYFRIWIVNILLTIVTLGIYGAWAKVRTRQYFYANTRLGGASFSFLGNPKAILKGNIIIGGLFALYSIYNRIDTTVAAVILAVFYLFLPYLIYKSYRFNLHNSSYRNIRFGFSGTTGESYIVYLLYGALLPITLGIIYPYWSFRRKKYFLNNITYGKTEAEFNGRPGKFYTIHLAAAAFFILFLACLLTASGFISSTLIGAGTRLRINPESFAGFISLGPLAMILTVLVVQQLIAAALFNYCWPNTRIGSIRFESTVGIWRYLWIRASNLMASVFTIGLLIPWAKVRFTRYLLANITVVAPEGLENFSGSSEPDESALGYSATDFFDIGFGL